jgi:polygalacturonase
MPWNVKDFGAAGNGVWDDTAAINAAISVAASQNGGVVFFPAGTYITSSTINLPAGVWLRGTGNNSIIQGLLSG